MQVKTFRAATISKALELVKKELGPDAIILGNRKVSDAPYEARVEVMAAIEPDKQAETEAPANTVSDGRIRSELREIKSFLSMLISSKDTLSQLQTQQPVAEIYHSLLTRGLDEKYTFMLLKSALAGFKEDSVSKRDVAAAFCKRLLDKIRLSRPFDDLHAAPIRCFSFVGPTGVGKTTTLAKLAAQLKLKQHLDVAVISLDTYRIGAVEQLRTYADILEVPLFVAQNRTELEKGKSQFQHHDVVLIDTIGKNYLDRQHIGDLQQAFGSDRETRHFLVLSATAKDEDLKQTIRNFDPLNIESVIFTKLDETLNHGCLINQLLRFDHPLAFLGTGQRVPEDVVTPSRKYMLSLLFPAANGTS